MYVCVCYAVTDKQVKAAVEDGAMDIKSLQKKLNVGKQCGQCIRTTLQIMEETKDLMPNYYEVA